MDAFLQGIVQGLTEFLPVSSSGHLVLMSLFGFRGDLPFVAFLHLGTFFAVLAFTFKELLKVLRNLRLIVALIVSTAPAALVWILFKDAVERSFNPRVLPLTFSVTALFLLLASVKSGNKRMEDITFLDALIIGVFQAFALLPGISRSGMTISAALLLGYSPESAVYYSFLMSLPATLAGGILNVEGAGTQAMLGLVSSLLFGLLALFLVRKAVFSGKFHLFSYYLVAVSIFAYFGVIA